VHPKVHNPAVFARFNQPSVTRRCSLGRLAGLALAGFLPACASRPPQSLHGGLEAWGRGSWDGPRHLCQQPAV